jgi:ABC-2 type transport system permease protein
MKVLVLLAPRWWSFRNSLVFGGRRSFVKSGSLLVMALGFWAGIYVIFHRVLRYFQAVEEFGDLLAYKLLTMVFLTFFGLLVFSNVLVALNTFFLSQDLETIHATPVSIGEIFAARFLETLLESSWMVLLFGIPVFTAYGLVYRASLAYYLGLLSVIVPYLILAAALGITLTMILVQIFPSQRTRDILLLLSILVVILLLFLFRFTRPERLVNPDSFSSVVTYFRALSAPTSPYLPSSWASEAIALMIYPGGWSRSRETRRLLPGGIIALVPKNLRPRNSRRSQTLALMGKDLKFFFRDNTQWSQLLLIFALIVLYLYNYSVLPLDRPRMPTFYLQNLVAFLNVGLAGFVLASIGVRFVFTAVSAEGSSFWIMQSAPLSIKRLLWSKFLFYLSPLLLLGLILTIATNQLLQVTPLMLWLAPVTIFSMVFGITALGVGMGAAFANFKAENLTQVATGFGGLLYMILAMGFITLVVVLEAGPVYTLFMAQVRQHSLSVLQWFYVGGSVLLTLLLNVAAIWLPMRYGIRKLGAYEA